MPCSLTALVRSRPDASRPFGKLTITSTSFATHAPSIDSAPISPPTLPGGPRTRCIPTIRVCRHSLGLGPTDCNPFCRGGTLLKSGRSGGIGIMPRMGPRCGALGDGFGILHQNARETPPTATTATHERHRSDRHHRSVMWTHRRGVNRAFTIYGGNDCSPGRLLVLRCCGPSHQRRPASAAGSGGDFDDDFSLSRREMTPLLDTYRVPGSQSSNFPHTTTAHGSWCSASRYRQSSPWHSAPVDASTFGGYPRPRRVRAPLPPRWGV